MRGGEKMRLGERDTGNRGWDESGADEAGKDGERSAGCRESTMDTPVRRSDGSRMASRPTDRSVCLTYPSCEAEKRVSALPSKPSPKFANPLPLGCGMRLSSAWGCGAPVVTQDFGATGRSLGNGAPDSGVALQT